MILNKNDFEKLNQVEELKTIFMFCFVRQVSEDRLYFDFEIEQIEKLKYYADKFELTELSNRIQRNIESRIRLNMWR